MPASQYPKGIQFHKDGFISFGKVVGLARILPKYSKGQRGLLHSLQCIFEHGTKLSRHVQNSCANRFFIPSKQGINLKNKHFFLFLSVGFGLFFKSIFHFFPAPTQAFYLLYRILYYDSLERFVGKQSIMETK